jgi:hypothetical protein
VVNSDNYAIYMIYQTQNAQKIWHQIKWNFF